MKFQKVIVVLALNLLAAVFIEGMALSRMGIEPRCQCIRTESTFINPRLIRNVELIPSGPHCPNTEVIATLQNGLLVCLDPNARWVKIIIERILENSKVETNVETTESTVPTL
ncbi:interleukin-8-like [Latimeria chalumnae]|uniref:interleukin-8-like n=1 Tax=Latimeria chalumnae TaxID=7897 RepID=UPI00313B11CF